MLLQNRVPIEACILRLEQGTQRRDDETPEESSPMRHPAPSCRLRSRRPSLPGRRTMWTLIRLVKTYLALHSRWDKDNVGPRSRSHRHPRVRQRRPWKTNLTRLQGCEGVHRYFYIGFESYSMMALTTRSFLNVMTVLFLISCNSTYSSFTCKSGEISLVGNRLRMHHRAHPSSS